MRYADLPWWRRWLVEIGTAYLGWVLPADMPLQVSYEPKGKTWSVQVLEEDAARKLFDDEHRN